MTAGQSATRLRLYPNPARSETLVSVPAGAWQITVTTLLGQRMRTIPIAAAATEVLLPLPGLPAGMYLVQAGAAVSRLVVE